MNFIIFAQSPFRIVIYIIVFVLALATLITIHELGHLIVAKIFKVYCTDFSIGFGPKIVKIKRKQGETAFSIGAFPFGGYVAMVSDAAQEGLEELNIPKERTLQGIKRWKRICIMLAGVTMNFILAYLLFLISASCFPQVKLQSFSTVDNEVSQKYLTTEVPFQNNDSFLISEVFYNGMSFEELKANSKISSDTRTYWLISRTLATNSNSNDTNKYVVAIDQYLQNGIDNLDFSNHINLYVADENPLKSDFFGEIYVPKMSEKGVTKYELRNDDTFNFDIAWKRATDHEIKFDGRNIIEYEKDENGKVKKYNGSLKLSVKDTRFEKLGIGFYKFDYWYGLDSFKVAGEYWVEYSQTIGKTIGGLFAGKNWDQIGGPIAMYTQTTQVLETSPFYMYLLLWGIVSINLGIVNLLPFPGLDGYQVLVEIIEGSVNGIYKLKQKGKKKKKDKEINNNDLKEDEVSSTKDVVVDLGEKSEIKEWKIPAKIKTIVSFVGLGLLLAFSLFLIIRDTIGLF